MAKVKIVGGAAVIISSIKYEDIKLVKKYRPDELILKDENDEAVFAVYTKDGSSGGLNDCGAIFGKTTQEGFGIITMTFDIEKDGRPSNELPSESELKELFADDFGIGLTNLAKLEKKLPEVINEIKVAKQEIINQIEFVQ